MLVWGSRLHIQAHLHLPSGARLQPPSRGHCCVLPAAPSAAQQLPHCTQLNSQTPAAPCSRQAEAIAACYQLLPAVHRLFRRVAGEEDDYIAQPKVIVCC